MKRFLPPFLSALLLLGMAAPAAQAQSTHQEEAARYQHLEDFKTDAEYGKALGHDMEKMRKASATQKSQRTTTAQPLSKRVLGWYPYWNAEEYTTYDFSNFHTIAYFSYEVNPSTGGAITTRTWNTTGLIAAAHAAGVKVVLTVTNFGNANNATLLNSPAAKKNLINNLITVVKARNGDGVNIDFETVGVAQRDSLTKFMNELSDRFHAEIPGSLVSIALPAIQWTEVFMVRQMTQVDDFYIMGYDYHYSGSLKSGPVAPLKASNSAYWGSTLNSTYSVNWYLGRGVPANKLHLAVPYYGRQWATKSGTVPDSTRNKVAASISKAYATAKVEAERYGRQWSTQGDVPYYTYQSSSGQWYQVFYDDPESLGLKYDLVNQKGLAGIGIWALGHDKMAENPELNAVLREKFPPAPLSAADELDAEGSMTYPNPVKRGQDVALSRKLSGVPVALALRDAMGRNYPQPVLSAQGTFSTQGLASGVYFLTATTAKGSTTHRVVVVD
ncbi:glycosyl hydrolase family 18 protein [Rufibacter sp. LB8]|uniref:glycosyl hydrolase family 18 protein n=1 Tax=Rufibacter sp. LB8 TaxID=2777781 RepID=UPI00178C20EE|nr:glycosyl hydrolase family 18 protein [Rufibacter sp. LB8]